MKSFEEWWQRTDWFVPTGTPKDFAQAAFAAGVASQQAEAKLGFDRAEAKIDQLQDELVEANARADRLQGLIDEMDSQPAWDRLKAEIERLTKQLATYVQIADGHADELTKTEAVVEAARLVIDNGTALYVEPIDREYWTAITLTSAERLRRAVEALESDAHFR